MKTPRNLLLEHHRDVQPKLAALRREVLARLQQEQPATNRDAGLVWLTIIWLLIWRELILPCRRGWSAIAAAWVLILGVNFALRDPSPEGRTVASAPMMMSLQAQQRLLNELLADRSLPVDADRPKTPVPSPRSMRSDMVTT